MTNHSTAVAIARAQENLTEARNCVDCVWLAAGSLDEKTAALQYVANIAVAKIDEALEKLDACKREL
jgi:hypothetical protein